MLPASGILRKGDAMIVIVVVVGNLARIYCQAAFPHLHGIESNDLSNGYFQGSNGRRQTINEFRNSPQRPRNRPLVSSAR